MTHAEIMALEAGPETDALVARHTRWIVDKDSIRLPGIKPGEDSYSRTPAYSTSITEVYEAEEALPEDKRALFAGMLEDVVGVPTGGFPCYGGIDHWHIAHASPLDRCKALLITLTQDGRGEDGVQD